MCGLVANYLTIVRKIHDNGAKWCGSVVCFFQQKSFLFAQKPCLLEGPKKSWETNVKHQLKCEKKSGRSQKNLNKCANLALAECVSQTPVRA